LFVRRYLSVFAAILLVGPASAADVPSELTDYVFKKDDSFSWKLVDKKEIDTGTIYTIDLISQTWHDIQWDHKLQVYVTKGAKPQPTMLLWNQGGNPSPTGSVLGVELSKKVGAPIAFLHGIPKQPLFGGKHEDALIAETFVRYLETKDASWPLLFPMVKSLIRAMDALQAFAKQEWNYEVQDFVVTGASKRGWTSWLTGATGDKRVKAIAPLVIDTLNIPVQMKNHIKSFGRYSEMINDYTARKLVPLPDTTEARKLWQMVDPWVYRERITMPKMIINGTNDPYWPQDALNTYWDDLKGEKYILYVPNAGHDLVEVNANGKKDLLPLRAINTLAAFARSQIFNKPLPNLSWVCTEADGLCRLAVQAGKPKAVRIWVANAPTRDFRKARWVEDTTAQNPFEVKAPEKGYRVFYAECEYDMDGLPFTLCTQLRVLEAKK
jgi:PhoPQ-activated pathogenicity-related protein